MYPVFVVCLMVYCSSINSHLKREIGDNLINITNLENLEIYFNLHYQKIVEQTSLKYEMHREDSLPIYYVRIQDWYSLAEGFNLHKLIQVRKSGYNIKPLFNFLALMAIYLIMSQQIGSCIQMVKNFRHFKSIINSFIHLVRKQVSTMFCLLSIYQRIQGNQYFVASTRSTEV